MDALVCFTSIFFLGGFGVFSHIEWKFRVTIYVLSYTIQCLFGADKLFLYTISKYKRNAFNKKIEATEKQVSVNELLLDRNILLQQQIKSKSSSKDEEQIEKYISKAYKRAGLKSPKQFIWYDSPSQIVEVYAYEVNTKLKNAKRYAEIYKTLRNDLFYSVPEELNNYLSIVSKFNSFLLFNVARDNDSLVLDTLLDSIELEIPDFLKEKREDFIDSIERSIESICDSQHRMLIYHSYCLRALGINEFKEVDPLIEVALDLSRTGCRLSSTCIRRES